ncbi:unnamed protein product, partial [Brachionus calyciflorus]
FIDESKLSLTDIGDRFNINRTTVSKILKKRHIYENLEQPQTKQFKLQKGAFPLVEEALFKWYGAARNANIPINYSVLKEKALSFHQKLRDQNAEIKEAFEASDGWIHKFLKRYDLSSRDIYNCDETGLYYRLGPSRTIAAKSEKCKGTKKDKSRLTILFVTNASGDVKLKPFVIGTSARPRCMKNINFNTLPVKYANNSSAWMTGELWLKWLKWLDSQLTRDSVLLCDNCPAHVDVSNTKFDHLKIVFLPPNTTSVLQPLDAGIIKAFKANYRNLLVKYWIDSFDKNKTLVPINVKQAIDFIGDAWSLVSQLTIKRCWKHVGILPSEVLRQLNLESTSDNFDKSLNLNDLSKLLENLNHLDSEMNMSSDDYLEIDSTCGTFEVPKEDDIINDVLVNNNLVSINLNQKEDDVDDDIEIPLVSKSEALDGFKKYISYLEHLDGIDYEDIKKLKEVNSKADLLEISKLKQQKILNFFTNTKK